MNGEIPKAMQAVRKNCASERNRRLAFAYVAADSRAESFRVFKLRFDGDTVSELELTQSQAEYEDAQARIPLIESQIAQQEHALRYCWAAPDSAEIASELLACRPDLH